MASSSEQFSTSIIFNDQQRDLIHHVAFDFHGRRIATSSSDMMVCVWNLSPNGVWIKSASWKVLTIGLNLTSCNWSSYHCFRLLFNNNCKI